MKKTLLIITLAAAFTLPLHAQNAYADMLTEGKIWEFVNLPGEGRSYMAMMGDTVIDGFSCKRFGVPDGDGSLICLAVFRQDDSRIYRHDTSTGRFIPAFDFGVSPGDIMEWDESIFHIRLIVTDIGTVSVRGIILRKVDYEAEWSEPGGAMGVTSGRWIEGVGGSEGPLSTVRPVVGNNNALLNVSCGGMTLCDREVFNPGEYDKRMLTYAPVWVWHPLRWNTALGIWEEDGEERAWKTGVKVMSLGLFIYTTVAWGEDGDSPLLLRESAGKVYAQRDSYKEYISKNYPDVETPYEMDGEWSVEVLLYDFTLGVGEKYPCRGDVSVEAVSSVTTRDGLERKVQRLSNGLVIIEGIGCVNALEGIFAYQNSEGLSVPAASTSSDVGSALAYSTLQSYEKYKGEPPLYLSGDISLGLQSLLSSKHRYDPSYDLQGRRLQATPIQGIYIQNGRKYVK